jgi:triacylglycerol esterase/lipase EstA (alpha/beta hydrolase family)
VTQVTTRPRRDVLGVLALLAVVDTVSAAAPPPAPARPLTVPAGRLAASLECAQGLQHPSRDPVLLVHGTFVNPIENWGWGYEPGLRARGLDVCSVWLPNRSFGDILVSSEYVAYAIRTLAAATGRKVDVVGLSQGGLEPRVALKLWPDTLGLVDDVVTIGTPHHGAFSADLACLPHLCEKSFWQMRTRSNLLAWLNAGDETPGGADYTSVFSSSDTTAFKPWGAPSPALEGAVNVRVQAICPWRPVGHAALTWDAVAFAVVMDALDHPGPADPSRIPRSVCRRLTYPGVDPLVFLRRAGRQWSTFPYPTATSREPPSPP